MVIEAALQEQPPVKWVDFVGNPTNVSEGMTANACLEPVVDNVTKGRTVGHVEDLFFRDPDSFRPGELHRNAEYWEAITTEQSSAIQADVLRWVRGKIPLFEFAQHYKGSYKGQSYDSDRPPRRLFLNNQSCRPFVEFVRQTLLHRLRAGAVSLLGKVGEVEPPHIVHPLTVEPKKPRLCYDARYINLWMRVMPFTLDKLSDLPRYVSNASYQTVLDDMSGYDHLLLTDDSTPFFGIQWGGWFFTYNTLPFGWKCSPYVYHTTGLVATHYLRSIGVPCSLYIDDRHNGQLQARLDEGAYANFTTADERRFAAAQSAIFLVCYHLIRLGYFLGLKKSILVPRLVVPYLGFSSDSVLQVFHLLPDKKARFLQLVRDVLHAKTVTVKTLQRLVGKCISFSLAVPAARLFTREMNGMISWGLRTLRPVPVSGPLMKEIQHWLFLETWDAPLPWRDERHFRVSLATDASATGWGGSVLSPVVQEVSDYWVGEELSWDIATKEAVAIERVLLSCRAVLSNAWVDVLVDNQAVIHSWNNQGGRSVSLNRAIKQLFFTTLTLNISLHLSYVPTGKNPADVPSRRLSAMDSKLTDSLWEVVQKEFGGDGHTCDMMALDSNAMLDCCGNRLPHFTPYPTPESAGVNVFAQDLASHRSIMQRPYVFPPSVLVGPLLRFLEYHQQSFTIVVLDVYPRKYWWPLLQSRARSSRRLASAGDRNALLVPSKHGWIAHPGLNGDLWAFAIVY